MSDTKYLDAARTRTLCRQSEPNKTTMASNNSNAPPPAAAKVKGAFRL